MRQWSNLHCPYRTAVDVVAGNATRDAHGLRHGPAKHFSDATLAGRARIASATRIFAVARRTKTSNTRLSPGFAGVELRAGLRRRCGRHSARRRVAVVEANGAGEPPPLCVEVFQFQRIDRSGPLPVGRYLRDGLPRDRWLLRATAQEWHHL